MAVNFKGVSNVSGKIAIASEDTVPVLPEGIDTIIETGNHESGTYFLPEGRTWSTYTSINVFTNSSDGTPGQASYYDSALFLNNGQLDIYNWSTSERIFINLVSENSFTLQTAGTSNMRSMVGWIGAQ